MTSFNQKYRLGTIIIHGNRSTIFECIHKKTGEKFACKVVKGDYANKTSFDENNSMICKHPNINVVHDVYYLNDKGIIKKMIISDLGHGDLFNYLEDNLITEYKAKSIIKQMVLGINYLHNNNICHRDIKLENFIYSYDDTYKDTKNINVKLIDFEFSRQFARNEFISGYMGTPSYIAPEIKRKALYNHQIDIWSLGISCYILLTDINPMHNRLKKKYNQHYRYKNLLNFDGQEWKNKTSACKDFISCMLKTNPQERYKIEKLLQHDWISA